MMFGDGVMEGFTSKTEPMGLTEVGWVYQKAKSMAENLTNAYFLPDSERSQWSHKEFDRLP